MTFTHFADVAAKLAANGYRPVPILQGKKYPPMGEWQHFAFSPGCERRFGNCGAGILLGDVVGVDIDVDDPDAAAAIEQRVREIAGVAETSHIPRRTGRPPRLLLPFRVGESFSKMTTPQFRMTSTGTDKNKVEVLANGQQFVAYHVHPDTHRPYEWNGGGDLTVIPRSELPLLTQEQARRIIAEASDILAEWGDPLAEEPKAASTGSPGARIADGGRNDRLTRLGGKLRHDGLTVDEIAAALISVNIARCDPPLPENEVRQIARSLGRYEPAAARAEVPPPEDQTASTAYVRSPIDWDAREAAGDPPARTWAIDHWIGMGYTTLLSGLGGIGKSALVQQISTALAVGSNFIGTVFRPRTVLLWAGEDDEDELDRRQVAICKKFGIGRAALQTRFYAHSMREIDCTLVDMVQGTFSRTSMLTELREQVGDYGAEVVVLDNLARVYGGNENERHQVAQFLSCVAWAARPTGAAVLLLGHVAKAQGSEYSGSTAWENACRARLWLTDHPPDQKEPPEEDESAEVDDTRYLSKRKVNYTARDLCRLRYTDGAYDVIEAPSNGSGSDFVRRGQAERVLIAALRRLNGMGQSPTDGVTSPAYLPRLTAQFGLGENFSKHDLAQAMKNLMLAGKLVRGVVGHYPNRAPRYGLKEA